MAQCNRKQRVGQKLFSRCPWGVKCKEIKGYKAKDIIGQNFRLFYLPQDRQSQLPETLIREATINGRAMHEGLRVRSDGTTFRGTIVITALHDEYGNVIGFTKVTRKLTEREVARPAAEKRKEADTMNSLKRGA